MRLITVATLALSALRVSAQSGGAAQNVTEIFLELAQLPECATDCISSTLPSSSCTPGDFACLCVDQAYIASSGNCILTNCTVKQSLTAQAWQKKACNAPVRNTGPTVVKVGDALLVLGAVCIAGRFAARWKMQSTQIGWDDWTILAAYILLIPSTCFAQAMIRHGMGRDIWTVPFDGITFMLKFLYIEQYIYQWVVVLTKISIVLLYLRIFPREVSPSFHTLCLAVIAALLAYAFAFTIYYIFECAPISFFWTQWHGEDHAGFCRNIQVASYVNGGLNIAFDLVVFFLPVPKLLRLQVSDTRRKVGVVLTFLVGLFVTACSVVRLTYLVNFGKLTNATYNYNAITLWSGLEGDVGVICACMPSLVGPVMYLFRNVIGEKITEFTKSGSNKSSSASGSRVAGDKGIERLPSAGSAGSERGLRAERLSAGGIEKTTVTRMYNVPFGESSAEDVEMMVRGGKRAPPEWNA